MNVERGGHVVASESIALDGIVLPDSRTGELLDMGADLGLAVVSLIRHRFCLPCQQHLVRVRERTPQIVELGATMVAIGFSPPAPLALLANQLDWPSFFLSDEQRTLYGRLGLVRARRREVFTAGTLRIYRDATRRGQTVRAPVEDYLQLGGDALVSHGRAVRVFRPRSPDTRVSVDDLIAALREVTSER